jgi:signal transduction histidine kinase
VNSRWSHSSRLQTERTIAAARVILAASSLFAIWADPAEPARYVQVTYSLHAAYVAYAAVLAIVVWRYAGGGRLPLATHSADIVIFSVFQYLTLGPSSPFFVYFLFSLFCGALRWGWRGTLGTAIVVLVAYLTMGASMSRTLGPSEFELNRFIIRAVYLAVGAGLLVYLGQHEALLRAQIDRLARWPAVGGADAKAVARTVLEHAARILGAERAMAMWEADEEPWTQVASWSATEFTLTRRSPLEAAPEIPAGAISAPFRTPRVSGRVCFMDLRAVEAELIPLTEVVARETGASLDQLHVTRRLTEIAAREERLRLARDLHDGVLQSLTGLRLELQAVATTLEEESIDASRGRLLAIERAIALDQRELREFIAGVRPSAHELQGAGSLADRLEAVRERIGLEWQMPVTMRVREGLTPMPEGQTQAITLMVHEAIVNALKHAAPSAVSVDVDSDGVTLRIIVADDGRGFPFQGRYDHAALTAMRAGPVSLRERAVSLGGRISVESTGSGSRVEIALPVPVGGS